MVRTLGLALALVLLAPAALSGQQAATDQKVTVMVFPVEPASLGEDVSAFGPALRSMLITELGLLPNLRLVERQEIDELLQARRIRVATMTSDQMVEMARAVGAQYAVGGSMVFDPRSVRMDLRVTNIETGEILKPPVKKTVPRDQYLSVVEAIAAQLRNVKVEARVAEVVVPPAAILVYSRGLDYEQRGEKQKAAAMFRRALEIVPEYAAARAALGRVH